jgi:hypothetical protein
MPTITRKVSMIEGTDKASSTSRTYHLRGFYVLSAGDILDFPDAVFANFSCIGTVIGYSAAVAGDVGMQFGWTKGDAGVVAMSVSPYYNNNGSTEINAVTGSPLAVGTGGGATNLKLQNQSAGNITLCYDIQLFS